MLGGKQVARFIGAMGIAALVATSGSPVALSGAAATACPTTATRRVEVRTATDLAAALADARPGDVIALADGIYTGQFVAAVSGQRNARITLCGSRQAILDGGTITTGSVFRLRASYWNVVGFSITNGLKGIMTDGANRNDLRDLAVSRIGEEGIHFRTNSSNNVLASSEIFETGLLTPARGEGVYIGSAVSNWPEYTDGNPDRSDNNQILDNVIHHTTAESVDIKEGTSGGIIRGNVFDGVGMTGTDSWIDVKGNRYVIAGNRGLRAPVDGFQTHVPLKGWGNDNVFRDNVADVQASGYGFRIASAARGNVVECGNVVTNAAAGFANVACR